MNTNTATVVVPRGGLTEVELCAWFGQAEIGDTLTYHRGSLAHDRSPASSRLLRREQVELARVARRALALAEAGLAALAQRRLDESNYEYLIVVRSRPRGDSGMPPRVLASELGEPA